VRARETVAPEASELATVLEAVTEELWRLVTRHPGLQHDHGLLVDADNLLRVWREAS
jgi:hypothetical protein